ncbi:MAG: hypothetical protein JST93_29755 [Acidobacteria bacterium]|nr:hypothetical protein [Acidobacteriota bacterium]
MNIIFHIVAKDLRGLRWQALLVLLLQFAYTAIHFRPLGASGQSMAQGFLSWLIIATHMFFVSSAVHADAIPGDRQYWLTRPFTRLQLLTAKLLLTLCIIHVPLFLSDCLILTGHEFNPFLSLGGLLWRQALYFLSATMLMLALSAVTRNLTQFALTAIVLAAGLIFLPYLNNLNKGFAMSWGGLNWMIALANILLATTASAAILWLMYIRRRAKTGWAVLATTALVLPFATDLAPYAFAFRLQRQFHTASYLKPSIQFDPSRLKSSEGRRLNQNNLTLLIPIRVADLPQNSLVHSDRVQGTLRLPTGETRDLPLRGIWSSEKGTSEDWVFFPIHSELFHQYQDAPVSIDLTFYLTSFGNPRGSSMHAKSPQPRRMGELGRCDSAPDFAGVISVTCFAPIQLPASITAKLVNPMSGRAVTRDVRLQDALNYSPLPTDRFQFYPIAVGRSTFSIMSVPGEDLVSKTQKQFLESDVQFQVLDPQAHFTTKVTIPPMPLRDLVH